MNAPELPSASLPPAPRSPLTQARIETMVSRAIVLFGLVFGVLVIPTLLAQQRELPQPFSWIQAIALCLCLLWAVGAAIVRHGIGIATSAFAILYLVVLVLWPMTVGDVQINGTPWLWTLCTVASAYAAVRMPAWMAGIYVVLAPTLFCLIVGSISPDQDWDIPILDALYATIVGGVILTIASLLRTAASEVDAAQRAALDGYERGVREHLGEAERVEVDALVHDSVLTTLLAAASARTPDAKLLAARMARDALGHLSSTKPVPSMLAAHMTDAWTLVAGIRSAAVSIPHPARFRTRGPLGAFLPTSVAEALNAATVQAMLNSSQHASGGDDGRPVRRTVTFSGMGDGGSKGMCVVIADDGVGFDITRVAPRRLGLATSIIQRVEIVGGEATVRSARGEGTTITLCWPAALADHQPAWPESALDESEVPM